MKQKPLKVIAGAPNRPLVIGDIEIQCYVLEDETRVLTQQGFLEAVGRARKAKGGHGATMVDNPPSFLAAKNLEPFISNELERSTTPIPFQSLAGQRGYGYPAVLLPQVCTVYLTARDAGALLPSQRHIAERAEILIRGLATVGIIALVDEATGYQEIRDRLALHAFLDKFLLKERAKWAKRFPDEFYKDIFRLRGWLWQGMKINRPQVVAHYTNNLIWDRLAPGVRDELERLNPKAESGHRKARHHQWLTTDLGHPALQQHLNGVMVLMKSVRTEYGWDEVVRRIQRVYPKVGETPSVLQDE